MFYTVYGEKTDVVGGKKVFVRAMTIANVPHKEAAIRLFDTIIPLDKHEVTEGINTDPKYEELLTKHAKDLILKERSKPVGSLVYVNLVATHVEEDE
jgi:hypothetical protein